MEKSLKESSGSDILDAALDDAEDIEEFLRQLSYDVFLLRDIRKACKIRQSDAAKLVGVSQPYFSKIESLPNNRIDLAKKLLNKSGFDLVIVARNKESGELVEIFSE